jgi:[histone H3]-lysine36 N-dimethyltransferase SETMAR
LTQNQKDFRVSVCNTLLTRYDNCNFLKQIITGDETWIPYDNPGKSRQYLSKGQTPVPTPKPGLNPKKALLSVWWDYRGIIRFELREQGQTITGDVYTQQLNDLNQDLIQKRPALVNRKQVFFLDDNAKPHRSKIVQMKIKELGWEALPHPPYSPDIAPSDYHLFLSMKSLLFGNKFDLSKK